MVEVINADICVIGGGSGGLAVAAGASQMGSSTVLIEAGKMGGDCLNYGCVPSKSMIAAAHAAESMRRADRFGIKAVEPEIDFKGVHDHIHGVIAAIAPVDSVDRFEGLGVKVLLARAAFTGPDEVAAGGYKVRARRFVIATGSRAAAPPIPGLAEVAYLTNETIFDNTTRPEHLIVIGGGPIGAELAQAHRRLGIPVTLLEAFTVLGKDDPELTAIVKRRLQADGIDMRENVKIDHVAGEPGAFRVQLGEGDAAEQIAGSHLLVAAGRLPTVDGLDLDNAGVAFSKKGIEVDDRLRTTNKKIFAIGDVAGGPQFTHAAGYHAGIVIRNALFRLPAKVNYRALPWVTYTDPELAHVGMTEIQAKEKHGAIRILRWPYAENDRAQAERETEGLIKAVTTKRGKILGASIVGAHAGELIHPWVLGIGKGLKISDIANMIMPYPTLGEIGKRAAGSFYTPSLFSERTRAIVRFLAKFG
ncbi:MAG: FAD-dependent oxidoreductase [Alphaproteobacteria bacterium]|nr:FAD-dependent oxidoreductase [Alphaproteobacteria bacterium]